MLTVAEAQEQILGRARPLAPGSVALDRTCGLVSAETLVSDIDMPPFDKSAMDGLAVRAEDARTGTVVEVVEVVLAGQSPTRTVASGRAVRIMTGAPVPEGAETVVMVENTRELDDGRVEMTRDTPGGRNVCYAGEDLRSGQEILAAGTLIRPAHMGLLAAQGHARVPCHRRPTVSVLATGDEIVPVEAAPSPSQIRNANNNSLVSQILLADGEPCDLGIAADTAESLGEAVTKGLEADVLLLSGGVSAGTLDLVPKALADAGVETVFHHVAIKPGHPLLYGVHGDTHVFGLPGNPVSTFVCFEVFVRPLVRRLKGLSRVGPFVVSATMVGGFKKVDQRERYVGGVLADSGTGLRVAPIATHGPADLVALSKANCLIRVPAGAGPYSDGERVEVVPIASDASTRPGL